MCRCCCGLCNKKLSASIEHTLCWWTWYPDISRFHNYLLEHILSGVMAFRCYKIMVLFQIFLSAQCSCMRLKTGTYLSALCSSRCIKPGSVIWCLSSFIALLFFYWNSCAEKGSKENVRHRTWILFSVLYACCLYRDSTICYWLVFRLAWTKTHRLFLVQLWYCDDIITQLII